jgi:hypothetical protein
MVGRFMLWHDWAPVEGESLVRDGRQLVSLDLSEELKGWASGLVGLVVEPDPLKVERQLFLGKHFFFCFFERMQKIV